MTTPPRPPTDSAPAPSAPGNAGQPALGQLAELLGVDGVGFDEDVVELTATFADADIAESASLVAVIVSVPDFDGAVYAPDEVILPRAAVQETALLLVLPCTAAVNCSLALVATELVAGLTVTAVTLAELCAEILTVDTPDLVGSAT